MMDKEVRHSHRGVGLACLGSGAVASWKSGRPAAWHDEDRRVVHRHPSDVAARLGQVSATAWKTDARRGHRAGRRRSRAGRSRGRGRGVDSGLGKYRSIAVGLEGPGDGKPLGMGTPEARVQAVVDLQGSDEDTLRAEPIREPSAAKAKPAVRSEQDGANRCQPHAPSTPVPTSRSPTPPRPVRRTRRSACAVSGSASTIPA